LLRLEAKRFGAIGEKVRTRDFAFDEYGMTGALPADGIGHLSAYARLLGEHDSATVAAQPVNGFLD
jgi:hypothetical protein